MTLRRTLIVIEPANVDAANQAVALATGNEADALTFTVPLLDANDIVIGYVASWDFVGTSVDFDAVRKVIETATGASKDAARTERVTASGTLSTSKVLVYDAQRVPPETVISHLGAKLEPTATEKP